MQNTTTTKKTTTTRTVTHTILSACVECILAHRVQLGNATTCSFFPVPCMRCLQIYLCLCSVCVHVCVCMCVCVCACVCVCVCFDCVCVSVVGWHCMLYLMATGVYVLQGSHHSICTKFCGISFPRVMPSTQTLLFKMTFINMYMFLDRFVALAGSILSVA